MYNVKSPHAEEFIDHEEVLASLKYADEHKSDAALIDSIIEIRIPRPRSIFRKVKPLSIRAFSARPMSAPVCLPSTSVSQ